MVPSSSSTTGATSRDRGASLILALIFMTVMSLIVLSMAAWATTGLRSSISFTAAQSTVSTANSVAELALQESRYSFLPGTLWAAPPAPCWLNGATPSAQTLNSQPMSAYCSTRFDLSSYTATRVVTIDVCPTSTAPTAASDCAAAPYLQVVAQFDDYPAAGGGWQCSPQLGDPGTYWKTCGTYMKILSWIFGVNPPTVISAQGGLPTTSTCTTHDFTVTGTGFVTGSTGVYFVTSGSANQVRPASLIDVQSATYLVGCAPAGTGTAAVLVTTPLGQSQQNVTINY
ncbi:MAG: hypothetical protein KGJ92_06225 [Actinomycetales bacterium]|nr:hypothetical protein [Actinomycetales bacterium]